MSAPVSHDPIAVNTADGVAWMRRAVTLDGDGLYAVDGAVPDCPEFVLASLADLAERGIAGSTDVLPVPVGSEPQASELECLRKSRDAFRDQRNEVFKTNERLHAEVQESDEARLRAENDARTVRREAAALRARVAELEAVKIEASALGAAAEERLAARIFGEAEPDGLPEEELRAQRAALVVLLPTAPCLERGLPSDLDAARAAYGVWEQVAAVLDVELPREQGPSVKASADKLTRMLAPTQALREDDPPYVSRPLPPSDAVCARPECGHSGEEHHHGDTKCWAHLPKALGDPITLCACPGFVAGTEAGGAS
ncbi:hypothetical protein [Streptomyces lasiicapitis]|uniref:hypothetical protein n=1 Tax=Streptomyces lasiicapitis TaxID=1923961 RepID=UPI00364A84B5